MKITQNPDGSYREDKYTLVDFMFHLLMAVIIIGVSLAIADLIVGEEAVHNFLAEMVMMVR